MSRENGIFESSNQAVQTPEQQFKEFLSGLDLPNNPNLSHGFTNTNVNNQNPAYCFYSLILDRFKCLAAIRKLELENNPNLTNETLFYLMVIPDIAKHLDIINEVEYNNVKSLYQEMFQALNELENSSKLEVDYDLINSHIETLQKAGLNIDSISRSVQENSLTR